VIALPLPRFDKRLLIAAGKDWLRTDGALIVYILKVLLACLLALGVSLFMQLDQPRTAMITVFVVMQNSSGLVFAKSFYRLLGTLVGVLMSFTLVALFAQERELFMVCMAVWIGMCTAGSQIFRNFQSYAFVLAGYTLCIVGLPATLHPELTFDIAVSRVTELFIGLMCAALVSDLIFPQRMWDTMLASVRRRFSDFSDVLRAVKFAPTELRTAQPALLRFIGDIFSLESFRQSAILENDDSRAYRLTLGRLNVEFLEASTSFHAFAQQIRRFKRGGQPLIAAALLDLYQPLREAVALDGQSARTEDEAVAVTHRMAAFRSDFADRAASARQQLPPQSSEADRLGFDTGVALLRRLADELGVYAGTYASLAGTRQTVEKNVLTSAPPRFKMYFDPLAVALAGLRGALALGLLVWLWIATDWPAALEAITLGTVASTLFASNPSPTRTVRYFTYGALLGTALGWLVNFVILPHAQGFEMLALAVTPGIVLAAWLTTRGPYSTIGSATYIIFLSHLGFNGAYNANPEAFINSSIAAFVGVSLAGALFALIDLGGSNWLRRRTARALRLLVVSACQDSLALRRIRLESSARDIVQRTGSANRLADPMDRLVVEWLLSTLEIGNAVILLRQQMPEINETQPRQALATALQAIARLYRTPAPAHRAAVLAAIDEASGQLSAIATPNAARQELLTTLYFIRSALLDEDSVLIADALPAGASA
jgi:uncharacterized membrane protein YccC